MSRSILRAALSVFLACAVVAGLAPIAGGPRVALAGDIGMGCAAYRGPAGDATPGLVTVYAEGSATPTECFYDASGANDLHPSAALQYGLAYAATHQPLPASAWTVVVGPGIFANVASLDLGGRSVELRSATGPGTTTVQGLHVYGAQDLTVGGAMPTGGGFAFTGPLSVSAQSVTVVGNVASLASGSAGEGTAAITVDESGSVVVAGNHVTVATGMTGIQVAESGGGGDPDDDLPGVSVTGNTVDGEGALGIGVEMLFGDVVVQANGVSGAFATGISVANAPTVTGAYAVTLAQNEVSVTSPGDQGILVRTVYGAVSVEDNSVSGSIHKGVFADDLKGPSLAVTGNRIDITGVGEVGSDAAIEAGSSEPGPGTAFTIDDNVITGLMWAAIAAQTYGPVDASGNSVTASVYGSPVPGPLPTAGSGILVFGSSTVRVARNVLDLTPVAPSQIIAISLGCPLPISTGTTGVDVVENDITFHGLGSLSPPSGAIGVCIVGLGADARTFIGGNRGEADGEGPFAWVNYTYMGSEPPPALLAGNTWGPVAPTGADETETPATIVSMDGGYVAFDALCTARMSAPTALVVASSGIRASAFQGDCPVAGIDAEDLSATLFASGNWWGSADGPAAGAIQGPVAVDPWLGGFRANPDPSDLSGRPAGPGATATIHLAPEVSFAHQADTGLLFSWVSVDDFRSELVESIEEDLGMDDATALAASAYLRLGYQVTGANPASDAQAGWIQMSSDDTITLTGACPGTDTVEVALLVGSPYEPVPLGEPDRFTVTWTGAGCSASSVASSAGAGSVHGSVPPGGGTVASADGLWQVRFPGAPAGGYGVTLADVTGEAPGPAPGAGRVLVGGRVYEIRVTDAVGQEVHDFSPPLGPLTLTFEVPLDTLPSGADAGSLVIWYWDEVLGVWVPIPTTVTTDLETGTARLSAEVDHLTTFAVFTGGTPVPPDVVRHWSEDEVLRLVALGAVSGYEDGTFRPDGTVTRAEFAKILVSALGMPLPTAAEAEAGLDAAFADGVAIPAWARPYVAVAVQAGYLVGYPAPDGAVAFEGGVSVSRDQAATVLARVLEGEGTTPEGPPPAFADVDAVPDWARQGVAEVGAAGLAEGYPDGTFRPGQSLTRAEAAALVARLLDYRASHGASRRPGE